MRKNIFSTILLICVVLLVPPVFSEENTASNDDLTVEELYLIDHLEIMIINQQAKSPEHDVKMLAIKGIEELINSGNVQAGDKGVHLVLSYLVEEGVERQVKRKRLLVNYFPDVRWEACRLLGLLGGENSRETLLDILRRNNEPESAVLKEVADALGVIGSNENDEVVNALSWAINNQSVLHPDNRFALATIHAFRKIAQKNKTIGPKAIVALGRITQSNYANSVRNEALRVMRELKQYR